MLEPLKTQSSWNTGAQLIVLLGCAVAVGFFVAGFGVSSLRPKSIDTTPLLVGTVVWPGYEPLYLARELGYFDKRDVHLVEYSSATQTARNLANGTIDVAALTLDEAIRLRTSGVDVRIILVMDISDGGDVILPLPEIDSFDSLKGKRIGVETSAVGSYMLSRALALNDIDPSLITVVPIEIDEHEDAIRDKTVHAVVTYEPVRSRLIEGDLVGEAIFDSSMIPDEILDVLVTRRDVIESDNDGLVKLLQAWFEAIHFLRESPQEAAVLMAPRLKLEPAAVTACYDGLRLPHYTECRDMLLGDPARLDQVADQVRTIMLSSGLLTSNTESMLLADPRIISQINLE